jgi:hypothetical protein
MVSRMRSNRPRTWSSRAVALYDENLRRPGLVRLITWGGRISAGRPVSIGGLICEE